MESGSPNKAMALLQQQGHRLVPRRVGPARFERRPTIENHREIYGGPARRSAAGPTLQFLQPRQGDGPASTGLAVAPTVSMT